MMTPFGATRGSHGDHHARPFLPLPGRRGAVADTVTGGRQERAVDAIAVAGKLAEEK
jgi:hypothetical protein